LVAQDSPQVAKRDLFKIQLARAQVEAQFSKVDAATRMAMSAMRLLCGLTAGEPMEIAVEDLTEPDFALAPVDRFQQRARERRPEFRAIDAGLEAKRRL